MRRRVFAALTVIASVAAVSLAAVAADAASGSGFSARTGTVPPNDPTYYCSPNLSGATAILNYCRAKEGVGPITLPSNYSSLTVPEQELVVINLERVNRGEVPIVGLNAEINTIAQAGADKGDDPGFPDDSDGQAIYAPANNVLDADVEWMYTDECTPNHVVDCWFHRDTILDNTQPGSQYVGGGGYTRGNVHDDGFTYNSYTFEVLYDYHPDELVYTWAQELPFFATPPTDEPLSGTPTSSPSPSATPTVTPTASPTATPSSTPSETPSATPGTISRVGASHLTDHLYDRYAGRLKVLVTASDGTPMPGALVTFRIKGGHTRFYDGRTATAKANADGVATSPHLYAVTKTGTSTATATSPGAAGSVTWRLTVKH
jgi:hypothetical protein